MDGRVSHHPQTCTPSRQHTPCLGFFFFFQKKGLFSLEKRIMVVDVRFELTVNSPCPADDARFYILVCGATGKRLTDYLQKLRSKLNTDPTRARNAWHIHRINAK